MYIQCTSDITEIIGSMYKYMICTYTCKMYYIPVYVHILVLIYSNYSCVSILLSVRSHERKLLHLDIGVMSHLFKIRYIYLCVSLFNDSFVCEYYIYLSVHVRLYSCFCLSLSIHLSMYLCLSVYFIQYVKSHKLQETPIHDKLSGLSHFFKLRVG